MLSCAIINSGNDIKTTDRVKAEIGNDRRYRLVQVTTNNDMVDDNDSVSHISELALMRQEMFLLTCLCLPYGNSIIHSWSILQMLTLVQLEN